MSYLNTPRLTFSGQFQADPSTVNNDPLHFNNQTFQPSYQNYSSATDLNGWWNPDGTGNWRFIGCKITSVTYQDGTSTTDPLLDPIIGMSIMDTDSRTAGKIVDLDSQQQMVSELWGLTVRLVSTDGVTLMKGDYEVAAFSNIWFTRSVDQSFDSAAGATYQSIIKNITWNNGYANSRYINELKKASENQLSIQFNVDRYNGDNTSPQFTLGRITGSIGPSTTQEPKHFVLGRQLFPSVLPQNLQPGQTQTCNYAVALVDTDLNQLVLDFGNALQFSTGGIVQESRDLRLVINTATAASPNSFLEIGKINYSAPDWYMGTSGICTFALNQELVGQINQFPLAIYSAVTTPNDVFSVQTETTYSPVYNECAEYVCADKFVFRLDPGENPVKPSTVNFYVTNLGLPITATASAPAPTITIWQSGSTPANPPTIPNPPSANQSVLPPDPVNGIPTTALTTISANQTTPTILSPITNGKASLTLSFTDPGLVREFQQYVLNATQTEYVLTSYTPQQFMDGQYYSINYCLSSQLAQYPSNVNSSNTLSILIFNGAPASTSEITPGWDNFIQPIMQQYANLYPLMSKGVFNLADKNVVDSNAQILKLVFSKDPHDSNYMPATRDLSAYKKKVILNYLENIINNG
jgi:hypothetical protein